MRLAGTSARPTQRWGSSPRPPGSDFQLAIHGRWSGARRFHLPHGLHHTGTRCATAARSLSARARRSGDRPGGITVQRNASQNVELQFDMLSQPCYKQTDWSGLSWRKMASQRRGRLTRDRILQAAQESFAQEGYDATSVASICERAGVTKGGFYHHFPSKQALFLDLVQGWLTGLDAVLGAIRGSTTTVPEAIMQMTEMVEQVFGAARGQLPMFLEFWNRAARDSRGVAGHDRPISPLSCLLRQYAGGWHLRRLAAPRGSAAHSSSHCCTRCRRCAARVAGPAGHRLGTSGA